MTMKYTAGKVASVLSIGVAAPAIVMALTSPPAEGDPCAYDPGVASWANPCYAVVPPWGDSHWTGTNGVPGTWGPNGMYTPCDKPSGFC